MLKAYIQYILPKRLLTTFAGWIANSPRPGLKNFIIKRFIRQYQVDMSLAVVEDPEKYDTFNDFFTRQLKPSLRPITQDQHAIACPVDGAIAQIGQIKQNQLLQAKGFYFDLETLLGNDAQLAASFHDGSFATLYLAPHDYHRVHMPLNGKLEKVVYVPGKLFSVNRMTSSLIPQLYSRNERLICIFNTPTAGPMAIIFVGAMVVGGIKTVWMDKPVRELEISQIQADNHTIQLVKGQELGQFQLGSTVILLFRQKQVEWSESLNADAKVQFGQFLGKITE